MWTCVDNDVLYQVGGQSLSESISNLQRDIGNSVLYLPRLSKLLPGRRKGAVTLESLGKLEVGYS